jgi:hypothetical protein
VTFDAGRNSESCVSWFQPRAALVCRIDPNARAVEPDLAAGRFDSLRPTTVMSDFFALLCPSGETCQMS